MKVLVTGGNQGIGYALCRQLAVEHNCQVLLSARSEEKGRDAVSKIEAAIGQTPGCKGSVDFLKLDTSDDDSVASAAALVASQPKLGAIVNNAGIGLNTGYSGDILNTNLYGPKRVCEHFIPLLDETKGRIVNLGSGSGPMYVGSVRSKADRAMLCSGPEGSVTWADIEEHAKNNLNDSGDAYGLSKALLACYTGVLSRQYPNLMISCVTPGFIETQMTSGYGASKTPEQGTLAIRKCLFEALEHGSGWYYGSDGLRSPYHFMRSPGEPIYDGANPFL
jgi:carbonyl reductase 1